MPHAASTVVEALGRYPRSRGEDQLTELFALVLQTVPELSSWFIGQVLEDDAEAQIPQLQRGVGVFTQASAPGSGRPDMIIDYFDADGRPRRILSEHKIDADFTDIQGTAYERWASRDALVLVAPAAHKIPPQFDRHITWVSVARELERIVQRDLGNRGGRQWRRRALQPDTSSGVRLLVELLVMLEGHNVGVDRAKPIELSDVIVYQGSSRALEQMATLISMIREGEALRPLEPSDIYPQGTARWWFTLDSREVRWPVPEDAPLEPWAEIALQAIDDWVPEQNRLGLPLLYCGFYFAAPQHLAPASVTKRIDLLADAGIKVGLRPDGKQSKCAATLYLSELLVFGPSLRDQAEHAAAWAAEQVRAIVETIRNA